MEKILGSLPSKWTNSALLMSRLLMIVIGSLEPNDVFSVHFARHRDDGILGTQLTHENLTAGVAAVRLLFPTQNALTPLDTIVSAHAVSSPFGRAVLYTAVYEGSSFATLSSSNVFITENGKR